MGRFSETSLPRRLSRRQLVKLAAAAAALLAAGDVLAACGGAISATSAPASPATPSSAPASSAAGATAKPATSGAAAASAKPAASAAGTAKPSGALQLTPVSNPATAPATWDELVTAGKAEGKVVVTGAPDTNTREKLPAAFKQQFGIDVEYLAGATEVTARLQSERSAGQYTLDVEVNGSDSIYGTLLANGWLDPLKPALLMPEVADASKWKPGGPWFRDPKGDTTLQIFSTLSQNLTVNSQIVSPKDVPTADSLLDPKWKGKMCAFDPGANGAGLAVGSALYVAKGPDYVTKLYKGQGVVLSRDYKQLADWIAHGSYPIGLAVSANYLADYQKAGITIEQPEMSDAPNSVGGGFGIVAVMNRAPHPNAARVFANWMASKAGLSLYSQTQFQAPVRNDIDPTWLPANLIPKPGVKYLDTYEYNFETGQRLEIRDFFVKMLR